MNSFTVIFQRFCLDFQGTYYSEHLGMALNTSGCAEVDKIYVDAIKQKFL